MGLEGGIFSWERELMLLINSELGQLRNGKMGLEMSAEIRLSYFHPSSNRANPVARSMIMYI